MIMTLLVLLATATRDLDRFAFLSLPPHLTIQVCLYINQENKCFEEASEFSGDDNEAVFLACCNNVCTPATCSDRYEELIAQRETEELFVFYRPYDPQCPDRKKDGECLEILDNPKTTKNLDPETTWILSEKLFDEINWIRVEDNKVLVDEISQVNKIAA